jgi:hypothetical protein
MWRKLNKEEFLSSNPLLSQPEAFRPLAPLVWHSYEEYDKKDFGRQPVRISYTGQRRPVATKYIPTGEAIRDATYWEAAEGTQVHRQYEPLVDEPDLFIKFVRLFDSGFKLVDRDASGTIVEYNWNSDWFFKYGLLGLQQGDSIYRRGSGSGIVFPQYSDQGGPEENIPAIMHEAVQVNWLAHLYEAALSKNAEKLVDALLFHPYINVFNLQLLEVHYNRVKELAQRGDGPKIDRLASEALEIVSGHVTAHLSALAYPSVSFEPTATTGGILEPGSLSVSLVPRNLLGAMYIQFYWLITSARELKRCKTCSGLIAQGPPVPGSGRQRKTYSNKKYCSNSCRQQHYYKKHVKPARDSNRSHR